MMRATYRVLASLVVLALAFFGVAAAASMPPPDSVDSSGLRAAMSAARIRDHLVALNAIARANGGNRAMGTPGYQASVEYVRQRLTAAGYQVTLQPFQVPFFDEVIPPSLSRPRPSKRVYAPATEMRTMSYSGSGDVTAAVQPVRLTLPPSPGPSANSGCDRGDFAGFSRGAIALMQRGGCPFAQKATNAKDAGAAAALIMNEGQPDRRDLVSGTLEHPGVDIPVLGLSYAAGVELAAAPDSPVRVVTKVLSEYRDTVNVIADGGVGRTDRVLVVGAHLDSVPGGPGVNDDGSGVAVVLALADELARQPIVTRNRIRFALWGAEELGLLGSKHYVSQLPPEQRAAIVANLNFDMLGSPNFVRFVYDGDGSSTGKPGPRGSGAVERIFSEYLAAQGLAYEQTEFDGRSDYAPFADVGIPVGGLFSGAEERKTPEQAARYGGTAGQPMDSCYHRACDTVENISDEVLEQFGDAAADAVQRLLMTPHDPRETR